MYLSLFISFNGNYFYLNTFKYSKRSRLERSTKMRMDKYRTKYPVISLIILSVFLYFGCDSLKENKSGSSSSVLADYDFDKIKKRGKLVVLTDNNSTGYFVYRGEPMGFEYELLNSFSKQNGLELQVEIAKDMNAIFEQLNNGHIDLIAANLTVTKERCEKVDFTDPLLYTKQVLIQRKPEGYDKMPYAKIEKELIRNISNLIGKKVYVRKGSSFYSRLLSLSEEIGGKIDVVEVSGDNDTEALIMKVANGEIDYTIADENVALINQTYYPNIDVKTAISLPQRIAWAVRKTSPMLLNELNTWIKNKINSPEYLIVFNKYYKNTKAAGKRIESEYFSSTGNRISVYDEIIKRHSKKIGWDWRLIASLVCQESRFDPAAQSWTGAYGLMQIIPATSMRYGIDSISATPEQSLDVGTSYLRRIENYWKDYIKDEAERIKFVLASYNVGLGHVIDARTLTIKYNRKPNLWDNHVAYFLLQKSKPSFYNDPVVKFGYCRGQEPCNYVKEILNRYGHYKNFIETDHQPERVIAKMNITNYY